MKEDTLPMQEQGRVPDSLGLSILATDHLTCLPLELRLNSYEVEIVFATDQKMMCKWARRL